jgi:hypothetical protein
MTQRIPQDEPGAAPEVAQEVAPEQEERAAPRKKETPAQVLAARHPGAAPAQVEKYRLDGDVVVYLVNWGIKGTKHYRVPLSEFGQKASFFE